MLELIDTIKQNMKPNSVIILHGDHGFLKNSFFNTLCSIYYPDKDYNNIPAELTGVNLFRCVLNKFFGTKTEYKPDLYFATDIISSTKLISIIHNNKIQTSTLVTTKKYMMYYVKNTKTKRWYCMEPGNFLSL